MDHANASDQDSDKEIQQNLVTAGVETPADLQNSGINDKSPDNYVVIEITNKKKRNTKCCRNARSSCRKYVNGVTKNKKPHAWYGEWYGKAAQAMLGTVTNPSVPTNLASLENSHTLTAFPEETNEPKEAQAKQDKEKEGPKPNDCHQD